MKHVDFAPAALEEFQEAVRWYETRQDELGASFLGEIAEIVSRLEESPAQFPVWEVNPAYRKAVLPETFPYIVFFRESPDSVTIVAVAHGSRAPGYWMRRE